MANSEWSRDLATRYSLFAKEMSTQQVAPGAAGCEIKGIHHREAEAAGRHGVALGLLVLVEGDLHTRHPGQARDLRQQRGRRVAIARPVRAEQHDAVAVAPRF